MSTPRKYNLNSNKAFIEYTALFQKYTGIPYEVHTYIGRENSALKEVIDAHGYYPVLCAMLECLKAEGEKAVIMYATARVPHYLKSCKYPDLYWKVLTSDNPDDKVLWRELLRLETKWFPKASDKIRYQEIVTLLEGLKNEKPVPNRLF